MMKTSLRDALGFAEQVRNELQVVPTIRGRQTTALPLPETPKAVENCARLDTNCKWMQRSSESPEVIESCQQSGKSVVHNACILMYAN